MSVETPNAIACPKCNQSLPIGAVRCQFCGEPLGKAKGPTGGRGVVILDAAHRKRNAWSWKEWGYIICSCLIILVGVYDLLISFSVIPTEAVGRFGGGTYFGVLGTVQVAMGAALLSQMDWAQFVMKWICILGILNGLRSVFIGLMFNSRLFPAGPIIIEGIIQIAVLSAMLYFLLDMADV